MVTAHQNRGAAISSLDGPSPLRPIRNELKRTQIGIIAGNRKGRVRFYFRLEYSSTGQRTNIGALLRASAQETPATVCIVERATFLLTNLADSIRALPLSLTYCPAHCLRARLERVRCHADAHRVIRDTTYAGSDFGR